MEQRCRARRHRAGNECQIGQVAASGDDAQTGKTT
jgi:hypothetical protein